MSLSIAITSGKTLARNERANNAKLNALGLPTMALSGTASTAQLGDDTVTAAKLAFGAVYYCSASTSSNVITLTASGHTITLVTGMMANFEADATATAAITITFGGSTLALYRNNNVAVGAGDLRAGQQVEIRYDGAAWQLMSPVGNAPVIIGTDAGSTDDYVIAPTPSVRALADITGVPVVFKAATINDTGGSGATLTVSSLAATGIRQSKDVALAAGDIKAGQWVTVVYDGTYFQLQSPVTPASARTTVSVRQTVLTGPVDSNGHPLLLTIPSALYVTLKASSGSPLAITFAAGFDASGAVDYVSRITADVVNAWTVPAAAGTYYLYADRNTSTGAITYNYTSVGLIPRYVEDVPTSAACIAAGQHSFLINEMQMYLGDGAAAATVQRTFIGHVVTNGVSATSVVSYMFQGRFKSSSDQTIAANNTDQTWTETHKLGMTPRLLRWALVCQTADLNYAQYDEVPAERLTQTTGIAYDTGTFANATSVKFVAPWGTRTVTASLTNATSYAITAITAANWKLRAYAWRGW